MPKRCAASFTVDHSSVTIDIAAWTESVCPRNSDDETTAVTGSSVEGSVSRSRIRETSSAGCVTEILQQILILLGYPFLSFEQKKQPILLAIDLRLKKFNIELGGVYIY